LLAVTTVDGVNVISGETGATDQAGYVLDAYGSVNIDGWRKSMDRTAAFYFTRLSDSYAARTDRPNNVGVIGVAVFRERVRCCEVQNKISSAGDAGKASTQQAPSLPPSTARAESRAAETTDKLGTCHGRLALSAAQYTTFERAAQTPEQVVVIYYDSRRNLIARGVIPSVTRNAHNQPNPFPGQFVPDP
jgi:hypothetical protein